MFRLQELNPQEGDVIKVKFKPINQIMDENVDKMTFHEIEQYFQIQDNIKAYIASGDFLVESAICKDEEFEDNPYIEVKNHLDQEYIFTIHESVIDTIEIVDAAETFVSNDLRMIVIRIDHEMYINGAALIWDEQKKEKEDDKYKNHNRKLIRMFENFITDLAVRDTFQQEEG